ncbi:hypothetical protein WJX81_007649 [Elliptochloris bilobata]|uniref:Uncharacterized protein n=1 Tax=Elliptochloris bilobata TaxID=381761 RepID=A0AAW1RK79_9CHLO
MLNTHWWCAGPWMELASVSLEERCHIDRRVEDVWAELRDFGAGIGMRAEGGCCISLLPGYGHTALGSLRYTSFWGSGGSGGGFVERLLALDDSEFMLKWVLISHVLNENPFAAAFMDWKAQIRLFRVTISGTTLVEWACSFRTDPHCVAQMRDAVRALVLRGLQAMAPHKAPPRPPRHDASAIGVLQASGKMRLGRQSEAMPSPAMSTLWSL